MKKTFLIALLMVNLFILSACKNVDEDINTSQNNIGSSFPITSQVSTKTNSTDQITPTNQANLSPSPTAVPCDINEYYVIRDGYNQGKDIAVSYPQINDLDDANRQNIINEILKKDAMSYLDDNSDTLNLDISYEIKWKGNSLLSVEYYGWGEISNAPHPDKLSFITNININTGNKIELKDLFQVDQNILDYIINNGTYAGPLFPDDPGLMEEVQLNMKNDLATSNIPNIHFYFTRDSFGINIDVSHENGGYAMIETKYSDLKSYINTENDVWKDFDLSTAAGSIQKQLLAERKLSDIDDFTEISDQSFPVDLENWGKVRFVSGKDYQGKLLFFLTDDKNTILYQFPDYYDSYRKNQTVSAVAFRDVNKDGLKDIIIIATSDSKFTSCDIYFQTDYSFFNIPDLYHDLNQSKMKYDTINKIMDYMKKTGNSIVAKVTNDEQWKQAYIDYIQSSLSENSYAGYELIHLDNDDNPELVAIGNCEAQGNLVCNYDNGTVISTQLSRLGFYYIERENLLCNSEGLMDYYYDLVYSLIDGKLTQIAAGYWGELDNTGHHFDKDGNLIYQYSWEGASVTEDEYNRYLNSTFDMSKAITGYMNQPYSMNEIISKIEKY